MKKLLFVLPVFALMVGCSDAPKNETVETPVEVVEIVEEPTVYPYFAGAEFDRSQALNEDGLNSVITDFDGNPTEMVLTTEVTSALATAADSDWELEQGISFVGLNALVMRRYMYEYGWKHEDFAPFSINAHNNGAKNPNARFQSPITEEIYKKAAMIADPINLMDASPIGDGAAAAIVVPADLIKGQKGKPIIRIAGSAVATDSLAVHDRHDPLWLAAAEKSAKEAYRQADVTPNDIDFFEIHDAFSIMAALSLEACGFAERGQGPRLALDGEIGPDGKVPLATMGGLKARGHPVGATGMYQIVETVQQLRGEAGPAQIDGVSVGMAQNIGGSGATIITHILKAE